MSDTPGHPSGLSRSPGSSEGPVARLSALWRHGQEPDLRAFLAGAGRLNAAELTDVLCTDQRQRWLHGLRPEVEAYISLHGSFHPGAEPAIDLVFGEFLARRELGESPTLDEYCRRFPALAGQLRLHVGLYDALREVGPARDDSASGPGEDPSTASRAAQTPAVAGGRPEADAPRGPEAAAFESDNEAVAAEGGGQSAEVREQWVAGLSAVSRFSPAVFPELPGYEILGEAGRGGMGIVYKARQLSLQRLVAIKVVPFGGGGDEQIVARFHQEGLLGGRLAHPNLVVAYDAGAVTGLPYFVMEFVDGTGLDGIVRRRGPLPVAEACEVVRQVALGLQHIHEQGVVHRDVKPSNLMLTPSGQVKLLDLGLARLVNDPCREGQITSSGQFLGTLDYIAPEQCDNSHAVDIRADIYSLGCTLYHLLEGSPPFATPGFSSPYQKLKAHAEVSAAPICQRRPDVPEQLAMVVARMLAKDRDDRFAIPAEIVAALHPFAVGADLPSLLRAENSRLAPMAPAVHTSSLPLPVGLLHSFSGTMVLSEVSVADATLLAIEEINQRGGIRGKKLEVFVSDCRSDEPTFAREAERLITQEKVRTLFGCWTSASRKELLPVLERHDHLLVYPVQYEGLEQSPYVVYTGATPNQQMLPAVRWAFDSLGARRFFLLGWDSVYSHVAHAVIQEELAALGGQIAGEEYLLPASTEVSGVVRRILETQPDVILNTVVGDRNIPLCRTLRATGAATGKLPTIYFSVGEVELRHFADREIVGDYAAWNYFQSLDRPQNKRFVSRFRQRYGPQRVLSDTMEAAYVGVHLWAQAAESASGDDARAIREALRNQSFDAPGGVVRVDPDNQHTWKTARIGRVVEGGQFNLIWESATVLRPIPFPDSRPAAAWHDLLTNLFQRWDGHWSNPHAEGMLL
jgi:urea transport system substrate-binding protein